MAVYSLLGAKLSVCLAYVHLSLTCIVTLAADTNTTEVKNGLYRPFNRFFYSRWWQSETHVVDEEASLHFNNHNI